MNVEMAEPNYQAQGLGALAASAQRWLQVWGEARVAAMVAEIHASSDIRDARNVERELGDSLVMKISAALGPVLLFSKTHTRWDAASPLERVAAVVAGLSAAPLQPVQGVGIDVERSARPVSDAVLDRLCTSEERKLGLSGIEYWIIKEACFKACQALGTVKTISQVRITGTQEWSVGSARGRYSCQMGPEWALAAAILL